MNRLHVDTFDELYDWFINNYQSADHIWVNAKRGKPNDKDFSYYDAVYCALCFGWIDSTCKNIDGVTFQKLVPRSKKAHCTYLNIARCKYLIKQGLMTDVGLAVMPATDEDFIIAEDVLKALQADQTVWKNFNTFPELYKRIRIDNIEWARNNTKTFNSRLNKLIETAREKKMYGQWDDYGRLTESENSSLSEENYGTTKRA